MEDLNNIIDMSHATGFSKLTNDDFLPYGKSCLTWQDVKASHDAEDGQVVIRLEEVFGMLIILFVGLSGAAVTMALECLIKRTRINKASGGKGKVDRYSDILYPPGKVGKGM